MKYKNSEGQWQNIPALKGKDGATFTPHVSEDGVLSWTNDKGLENPASVNVKDKVKLDTVLEVEGRAADAKAVGDRITEIENNMPTGITVAQSEQIETNKNDIAQLKTGKADTGHTHAEISEIKEDLEVLENKVLKTTGEFVELELPIKSGYVNADGSLSNSYFHIETSVKTGEQYLLKAENGANVKLYTIKNSDGYVTRAYQGETWGTRHDYDVEIVITEAEENGTLYVSTLNNSYIGIKKYNETQSLNLDNFTFNGNNLENKSVGYTKFDDSIANLFLKKFEPIWNTPVETGYMKTDGTLASSGATYFSLNVLKGETYKISSNHGFACKLYILTDLSGNVLEYYPNIVASSSIIETVEIEIKSDGILYINSFAESEIRIAKAIELQVNQSNLVNKKVAFFGDSICKNKGSWADANTIRLKNNMTGQNFGVCGSVYTVKANADHNNCIYNRVKYIIENNIISSLDYIILEGGVNDAYQSLPLGTLLSNSDFTTECDTSTFAGAFEMTVRFILKNCLGVKLGYIAIYKMSNNPNMGQYLDVAKTICEKYSVPILDLYNESGVCIGISEVKELYCSDGTHISLDAYDKYINDKVEVWMESL